MRDSHPFKHCDHENKDGSFMSGMLVGLVVGGILGVLFAPDAGEKTRKKLKETSDDLRDKGSKVAEDAERIVSDLKTAAEPLLEELERNVSPLLKRAKESGSDVHTRVLEKIEQLVDEDNMDDFKKTSKKFFKNLSR